MQHKSWIEGSKGRSRAEDSPIPLPDEKFCPAGDLGPEKFREFERFVTGLSVRFSRVKFERVDEEINCALQQILDFFRLDRCGLLAFTPDKNAATVTHACYGLGIAPVPEQIDISQLFPWAKERLLRGDTVNFSSLDEVPPEGAVDRENWIRMGVKSHMAIPIYVGDTVDFIIAAHDVRARRVWHVDLVSRLRLVGEILTNALVRKNSEAECRKSFAEIQHLRKQLQKEAEYLRSEIRLCRNHEEIIGHSAPLEKVLKLVEQVAPTPSTVLICGETGTGKELIAQAIHNLSPRRNKPLVKVNCASLPASLVESELFGREKGAFTGALTRQPGRFEVADRSTIFLDEIAEMSPELQAKLLRVLQEGEFERLGSTRTIKVDVRVIAATNRNFADLVKKGSFREDLYYRLNVVPIVVPPLRERVEDIPLLVWAYVNEFNEKMGKKINRIAKPDMTALQNYPWPGNVRELRNVIEYAVIVSTGDRLHVHPPESCGEEFCGPMLLEEVERQHVLSVLKRTNWRIKGEKGAAKILGLNPSTLYSRMQKLGLMTRQASDEISY